MPLELIYGQIGYLRIQCPWRHLGSRPVNVEVRDIWLVVCKYQNALWKDIMRPFSSKIHLMVNILLTHFINCTEPKTDSAKWESVETLETSFEKKEELVREMARALFEEMIVSILVIIFFIQTKL